ncbi:hypothetical protein QZH41_015204, partial [Actinostola sp. cb2023]
EKSTTRDRGRSQACQAAEIRIMTSTRTCRSSQASGSSDSYHTWPSPYQQPSRYVGDILPCLVHPRRCRVSWSTVSVFEIALLTFVAVVYLCLSERTLQKMLPVDDSRVNELGVWVLRLFASQIVMQVALLLCGISFGEVTARKIIYYGLLIGNVLSVAMYAAFVHSMSEWNAINVAFVATLSAFSLFRIVVLVLNPVWWVWKIVALT